MSIKKRIINSSDQIIKNMPQGLTETEKARYTYMELGKLVSFDEKYWFGNKKQRKQIYKTSKKIKDLRDIQNRRITCISLANIYNEILMKIGIDAITCKRKINDKHVYSLICVDGRVFKVDLQRDLKYIQTEMQTKHFGQSIEGEQFITTKELKRIDQKLGYSYKGEEFAKKLIRELPRRIMEIKSVDERVKTILEEICTESFANNLGYVEKSEYYKWLFTKVFNNADPSPIIVTDLCEESTDTHYTQCISVLDRKNNKYVRYIYSMKDERYVKIDDETLRKLMHQGLTPIGKEDIPWIRKQIEIEHNDIE